MQTGRESNEDGVPAEYIVPRDRFQPQYTSPFFMLGIDDDDSCVPMAA